MEQFLSSLKPYYEVFLRFIIPFGGGIPAGVLKAQEYQMHFLWSVLLYFISDVCLALVFEPIMLLLINILQRAPRFVQISRVFKEAFQKMVAMYGHHNGAFALIIVAFGADPMTGRAIAKAHGHGFLSGWAIAITGDMFYFLVVMASTLWVNKLIGDESGNVTIGVVLVLMLILPHLIKRVQKLFGLKID